LTLWWFSVSVHRRDRWLEQRLREELDVIEAAERSRQATHEGGALDV